MTEEQKRLNDDEKKKVYWKRWGPYLSERQWGTVREDYSPDGEAWDFFPFAHAHSKTYRWGEDGIGGISDNHQRLCFAIALWNEKDPILKERLFGLSGNEGVHGEDVKEHYFYLDSTPTHSYMKFLYNAILDGTDAVMLSGETAVGKYPVRAVKVMRQIIQVTQRYQKTR